MDELSYHLLLVMGLVSPPTLICFALLSDTRPVNRRVRPSLRAVLAVQKQGQTGRLLGTLTGTCRSGTVITITPERAIIDENAVHLQPVDSLGSVCRPCSPESHCEQYRAPRPE